MHFSDYFLKVSINSIQYTGSRYNLPTGRHTNRWTHPQTLAVINIKTSKFKLSRSLQYGAKTSVSPYEDI